jgi:hypothetical protein
LRKSCLLYASTSANLIQNMVFQVFLENWNWNFSRNWIFNLFSFWSAWLTFFSSLLKIIIYPFTLQWKLWS